MERDLSVFEEYVRGVERQYYQSLYFQLKDLENVIRYHEINEEKDFANNALNELTLVNKALDDEEKRLSILPETDNEDYL